MPNPNRLDELNAPEAWLPLPFSEWKGTLATVHMWTQIVGKIRLALVPHINHWWNVPLYVTPRGLTTGLMPYREQGLEIDFDFIDHRLSARTSAGAVRSVALYPRSVADFYTALNAALRDLNMPVEIWSTPVEIPDPIPFEHDYEHASYDRAAVERWRCILLQVTMVMQAFRGRFIGKSSPVHFFWGGFDLAVTRFNGRRAPEREWGSPVMNYIMGEAYSHEVSSAGWWAGTPGSYEQPAFYAYHTPEPDGFRSASVRPEKAFYHAELGEFVLNYDDMRVSPTPVDDTLAFFQSAYEAGATLARWDRAALEREQS